MVYQLWVLVCEWDRRLLLAYESTFTDRITAALLPQMTQRVSNIVNRGILFDRLIGEMGPRRTTTFLYPEPKGFSHVPYRCNNTVFLPILAFTGCTLLAQIVLTLRSVPSDVGQLRAGGG